MSGQRSREEVLLQTLKLEAQAITTFDLPRTSQLRHICRATLQQYAVRERWRKAAVASSEHTGSASDELRPIRCAPRGSCCLTGALLAAPTGGASEALLTSCQKMVCMYMAIVLAVMLFHSQVLRRPRSCNSGLIAMLLCSWGTVGGPEGPHMLPPPLHPITL